MSDHSAGPGVLSLVLNRGQDVQGSSAWDRVTEAFDPFGTGLGSELLVDALERIVDAAQVGGGRLIVVDAIDDEARAFYRLARLRPCDRDDAVVEPAMASTSCSRFTRRTSTAKKRRPAADQPLAWPNWGLLIHPVGAHPVAFWCRVHWNGPWEGVWTR